MFELINKLKFVRVYFLRASYQSEGVFNCVVKCDVSAAITFNDTLLINLLTITCNHQMNSMNINFPNALFAPKLIRFISASNVGRFMMMQLHEFMFVRFAQT